MTNKCFSRNVGDPRGKRLPPTDTIWRQVLPHKDIRRTRTVYHDGNSAGALVTEKGCFESWNTEGFDVYGLPSCRCPSN